MSKSVHNYNPKDGSIRLTKCLKLLQQKELDGLIIYSNGTVNILRPAYFHYFTGLRPLGGNNAVIISKDGKVVLLMEPYWDSSRVSLITRRAEFHGLCPWVNEKAAISV
jgi:hypothetical protein